MADFYRRMAESLDAARDRGPGARALRAGLPPPGRRGRRRHRLHQPVLRAVGHHRVGPQRGPGRGRHRSTVRVIDSRTLTAGLGTIVIEAAKAARDGASADEIEALVTGLIARTRVFATLDTLDNLKKGGRIGAAQHLLGSMLSFKPVINVSEGKVEEAGRARTRKKSLLWLRDKLFEEPTVEHLAVCDGEAPDVDEFLDLIASRYPRDQIRTGRIGAVIGTHGGPRLVGICYLTSA